MSDCTCIHACHGEPCCACCYEKKRAEAALLKAREEYQGLNEFWGRAMKNQVERAEQAEAALARAGWQVRKFMDLAARNNINWPPEWTVDFLTKYPARRCAACNEPWPHPGKLCEPRDVEFLPPSKGKP